jgi:hypothetical protein
MLGTRTGSTALPSMVKGFRKKEVERLAERDFAAGSNVVSDGLSCWSAVEEADCPALPDGDRFRQAGRELGTVQVGQYPGLFGSAYEWFVRVGLAAKGPAGRLSC